MRSSLPSIERARPLLGTTVRIRVHGLSADAANRAIDAAFREVEAIHRLMTFHAEDSEVSTLNRDAHRAPAQVDPRTYEVLSRARLHSASSDGAFNITVAPTLVARRLLPAPSDAPEPDPDATWRDIELLPDSHVRFRRPLWIDLGGIAKGYAVDRAINILKAAGASQACVNAGGDLRITGARSERVRLAIDDGDSEFVPLIEISDGSVASSCGEMEVRDRVPAGPVPHVETRRARGRWPRQFVSVMALRCIDADALTKVVMARGARSAPTLAAFSARAVVHDTRVGWREIVGHA